MSGQASAEPMTGPYSSREVAYEVGFVARGCFGSD